MSNGYLEYLRSIGFEDICTGGGCYGWYYKRGEYTYYVTVYSELTLPLKSTDKVTIGVYDSEFETQYMIYTWNRFLAKRLLSKIDMLERKMRTKKVQRFLKSRSDICDEIIYL